MREGCRASSRLRVREEWEWGVEVGENARAASEQERGGRARSSCLVRDRMQLARADAAANDAHFPAKQLSERKAFECQISGECNRTARLRALERRGCGGVVRHDAPRVELDERTAAALVVPHEKRVA